jgi:hypothetical protein
MTFGKAPARPELRGARQRRREPTPQAQSVRRAAQRRNELAAKLRRDAMTGNGSDFASVLVRGSPNRARAEVTLVCVRRRESRQRRASRRPSTSPRESIRAVSVGTPPSRNRRVGTAIRWADAACVAPLRCAKRHTTSWVRSSAHATPSANHRPSPESDALAPSCAAPRRWSPARRLAASAPRRQERHEVARASFGASDATLYCV